MNPLNVAAAKAAGWIFYAGSFNGSTSVQRPRGGYGNTEDIPDYAGDLNAAHELEKLLDTLSKRLNYLNTLQTVVDETCGGNAFAAMATAEQRTKAVILTLTTPKEK